MRFLEELFPAVEQKWRLYTPGRRFGHFLERSYKPSWPSVERTFLGDQRGRDHRCHPLLARMPYVRCTLRVQRGYVGTHTRSSETHPLGGSPYILTTLGGKRSFMRCRRLRLPTIRTGYRAPSAHLFPTSPARRKGAPGQTPRFFQISPPSLPRLRLRIAYLRLVRLPCFCRRKYPK